MSAGMSSFRRAIYIVLMLFAACGLFISVSVHLSAEARVWGVTRVAEFFDWGVWAGGTFLVWAIALLSLRLRRGEGWLALCVEAFARHPKWPGWVILALLFYTAALTLIDIIMAASSGESIPTTHRVLRVWSSAGMLFFGGALQGLFLLRRMEQIRWEERKHQAKPGSEHG